MKTSSIAYSIVNLAGLSLAFFVFFGIHRAQVEEGRYAADFGDGLRFFYYVVPAAVICLAVNLAWAGMALADIVCRREKAALVAWSVCVAMWGLLATMILTHHVPS